MSNGTDKIISEIRSDLKVLMSRFDEFSRATEKRFDNLNTRMDHYEEDMSRVKVNQAGLETKLSLLSIFQTAVSIAIGAVASFLGGKKG